MKKQSYKVCVFFTIILWIILSVIIGCQHTPSDKLLFQKQIDDTHKNNPYAFPSHAFVVDDIQKLKQNNLDIQIAQNRITQAESLYTQAFAGYLPQASVGMSGNKQISNQAGGQNAFLIRPQGNVKFYTANAQISFVPDFFGRTNLRTLIADNSIQSEYLLAQSLYLQVLNGYAKNYHLVCSTQSLTKIHKNMVDLNKNILNSAKIRYELGRSTVVDYYTAKDNFISAKIALDTAKQNHNMALQSYYSLIGENLNASKNHNICKNGFVKLPTKNITVNLQSLDNRPDIQAAQYAVKNAYHTVDLSLKAIYPDTTILFTAQNFSQNLSDVLDINKFLGNFALQLSQLVYDGGVRDAMIDISEANAKLATQTYQNTVLTAGNELITLGKNFAIALKLADKSKMRVQNAKKAFYAAKRYYKMGNIDFTNLINAQRNYYIAQTEYILQYNNTLNLYSDIVTNAGIAPIKM